MNTGEVEIIHNYSTNPIVDPPISLIIINPNLVVVDTVNLVIQCIEKVNAIPRNSTSL